jgi:hypothetical protein
MLVTGCLSEWLQGEILSTPPEHCKPIAKLDTKTCKYPRLATCSHISKENIYLLHWRHTLIGAATLKLLNH